MNSIQKVALVAVLVHWVALPAPPKVDALGVWNAFVEPANAWVLRRGEHVEGTVDARETALWVEMNRRWKEVQKVVGEEYR